MTSRKVAVGFAALTIALMSSQAQAGFLDVLFGRAPQQQPRYYEPEPLEMTVRPSKGRDAARKYEEVKPKLVTPIDPKENPDWYLTDPTLRKGDVVVLPNRVLVFSGTRGLRRDADFDELRATRLVSGKERDRIRLMTEYSRGPLGKFTIVPDTLPNPAPIRVGADKTVSIILP